MAFKILFVFMIGFVSSARAATPVPMAFVTIPPGTFFMGSLASEASRSNNEGPLHQVTLTQPFEMQTSHVTQFQWAQLMGTNPSVIQKVFYCKTEWMTLNGIKLCPNNPVDSVSWFDAQLFIDKLNAVKDGFHYRLPTEAEFEYAARAGSQTAYYFGDDPNQLRNNGWYYGNSIIQIATNPPRYAATTHRVGSKPANAFGLYDMSGNLWHWVQDYYANYSSSNAATNPSGPSSGSDRSTRGGSYLENASGCRSASRINDAFGGQEAWLDTGFRVVRNPVTE